LNLSMELKLKPLCQERLKHLFHLHVVDASFGFRGYMRDTDSLESREAHLIYPSTKEAI
jgi:hypothetical protein